MPTIKSSMQNTILLGFTSKTLLSHLIYNAETANLNPSNILSENIDNTHKNNKENLLEFQPISIKYIHFYLFQFDPNSTGRIKAIRIINFTEINPPQFKNIIRKLP